VVQQDVIAKWAANAPLAFIDQYSANLRQHRAIAIDIDNQDGLRTGARKAVPQDRAVGALPESWAKISR
jgi:hypothetical protein